MYKGGNTSKSKEIKMIEAGKKNCVNVRRQ